MEKSQVTEWIEGSLSESETFLLLERTVQDSLKKDMLKTVDKVQEIHGSEFAGTFLFKLSKELKYAKWTWLLTKDWPYKKWNTLRKSVYSATMVSMGIKPNGDGIWRNGEAMKQAIEMRQNWKGVWVPIEPQTPIEPKIPSVKTQGNVFGSVVFGIITTVCLIIVFACVPIIPAFLLLLGCFFIFE